MPYTYVVPGAVSGLTAQPRFISVVLTWSAPREPNGVVISYEVTYSIPDGSLVVTANILTDAVTTFVVSPLTPGTTVANISVRAYTRAGRGEAAVLEDVTTLSRPCELHLSLKLVRFFCV